MATSQFRKISPWTESKVLGVQGAADTYSAVGGSRTKILPAPFPWQAMGMQCLCMQPADCTVCRGGQNTLKVEFKYKIQNAFKVCI